MPRPIAGILFATAGLVFAQPAPRFEAADVHVSPKSQNPVMRQAPVRNGRYEIHNASLLDLIRLAYSLNPDYVLGGPSWLDLDRYDIIAKVPADATLMTVRPMLQPLLAERFRLVVHPDTRPMPAYALTAGKKPNLKPAEGQEPGTCKAADSGAADGGRAGRGLMAAMGLGPDGIIQYHCRNMTMAAFVEGLGSMRTPDLAGKPVSDATGLEGKWNFDVHWTFLPGRSDSPPISIFDAFDKQLGLKLEERPVPTKVLVVESASRTPIPNPPGTAEALPPVALPTAFEVASVKANESGATNGRTQWQAGGRVTMQNIPLWRLVQIAFGAGIGNEVQGIPEWASAERFDIDAKISVSDPSTPSLPPEAQAPLMRALLVDRFKMKYHNEERPVTAYSLVAAKPKLKKADPATRTECKVTVAPPGSPNGSDAYVCRNTTMALFAERLQGRTQELFWPILDATGLEGGWDFTLVYDPRAGMPMGGRGGDDAQPGAAMAAEPVISISIFDAIEKQLGLKLEKQKRNEPVIVIDHLEQKPTEN